MSNALLIDRLNLGRFFRGDGPQPSPYLLHHRNVYILPTREGMFFAVVLLIMLIGAINYSNSLGYLLTFLLASLAVIGILHTYRNLLHLRFSVDAIEPVFCGQTLRVPLRVDNLNGPARYALHFQFTAATTPQIFDLNAHSHETLMLRLPTDKRGRRPLGRFTLSSRFPLGLFRAWAHVELDTEALIYPRPADNAQLPPESLQKLQNLSGDFDGVDDFIGLRAYHPGDSPRHIHWKALAREQGLLTKQFGGERSKELRLDWRLLAGLDAEARLSQLTRWIIEAQRSGLAYGLWLPGQDIPPAHGEAHFHQCLSILALFERHV